MKWTKLIVNLNPMAVEAVANMIMELGIEGIEIDDNILTEADKEAMYVNYVDDSIVPHEEHRVIAYLDETQEVAVVKEQVASGIDRIKEFLEIGSGHIEIEVMPDEDYENKWKEYYKSFRVGQHLIITPIWEEVEVGPEDKVIKIDPGMAFGSGTHETTSLCIEYLLEEDCVDKTVVDVGCGSGILGITAAIHGAKSVTGVDIDENAVKVAIENVATNGVNEIMTVYHGNLIDEVTEKVDMVVANILADIIIIIASDVKSILKEDGTFIASGIILDKISETKDALISAGFKNVSVREQGEWAAMIAK